MIVIPMVGLSSRFFKSGFKVPKHQILLPNGLTVFEWAISSFERYFLTDLFIFIIRNVYDDLSFVKKNIEKLGLKKYKIVILEKETSGQAETVYLGLIKILNEISIKDDLYIFNIDSRRHGFVKYDLDKSIDGYLEVFYGDGDHWSFVERGENNKVVRTTEKNRISDLCSNGLYYFKTVGLYINLVGEMKDRSSSYNKGELYVAPLYNDLISKNKNIIYFLTEKENMDFCGTPDEYYTLCEKMQEIDEK